MPYALPGPEGAVERPEGAGESAEREFKQCRHEMEGGRRTVD